MSQTKTQLVEGLNINTSAPADALAIDNNGRVGVGTTSPGTNLHIVGTAGTGDFGNGELLRLDGGTISAADTGVGIGFLRTGSQLAYIQARRENNSNEAAYLAFATQTSAGLHPERLRIDSSGRVGIGTSSPHATLQVHDGTFVLSKPASGSERNWRFLPSDAAAGDLSIQQSTTAGGTTYSSKLTISAAGNVGIGTTSPEQPLHVENASGEVVVLIEGNQSAAGAGGVLVLKNNDTGANNLNQIQGADAGGQTCSAISFVNVDQANNEGELRFLTRPSSGNPTERFRFGSAGQFGIGGATYGTSGQVLTSQGSGSAPQWASVSGGLLQTKQTLLTATNSFSTDSTGAWWNVPGLSISITTTAANSKIIINAFVFGEHTDQEPDKSFRVRRTIGANTANISGVGTGSRPGVWNIMLPGWTSTATGSTGSGTPMNSYIDEPSQSSGTTISYQVQVWSINSGSTFFLNRTVDDNNSGGYERGQSYISLMEVSV